MKTGDTRTSQVPTGAPASPAREVIPTKVAVRDDKSVLPRARLRRHMLDGARTAFSVQTFGFSSTSRRGMTTVELPRTTRTENRERTQPAWRDLPKASTTTFSGHFAQQVTTGASTVPGLSAAADASDMAMRSPEAADLYLQSLFGALDQPHVEALRTALQAHAYLVPDWPFKQVVVLAEALWLACDGDAQQAASTLQALPGLDLRQRPASTGGGSEERAAWRAAMALAESPDGFETFLHLKGLADHRQLNGELPHGQAFASLPANGFDPANTVACETMLWRITLKAMTQVAHEPPSSSPTLAARCLRHVDQLLPALEDIRTANRPDERGRIDALIHAAGGESAYLDLRAYTDALTTDRAVRKAGKWVKKYIKWLQLCEKADKRAAWNWAGPLRNAAVGSSPLYSLLKMGDGGFSLKHSGQEMHAIHAELVTSTCRLLRMQLDLNIAQTGAAGPPAQQLERVALTALLERAEALIDPAANAEPRFLSDINASWLCSDAGQAHLAEICEQAGGKLEALGSDVSPDAIRQAVLEASGRLTPAGLAAASAILPVIGDDMVSPAERQGRLDILNGDHKFIPVASLQSMGDHVQGRLAILAEMAHGNIHPRSGTVEEVSSYFVRAMRWHQDNSLSTDDGVRGGIDNLLIPVPLPGGGMMTIKPTLVGERSASFGINVDNDGTRLNIGVGKGVNGALGVTAGYGWDFFDKGLKAGVFGDASIGGNFRMKRGVTLLMRRDFTLADNAGTPTAKLVNGRYEGMDTGSHRAHSMAFFRFAAELARNPQRLDSEAILAARRNTMPEGEYAQLRIPTPDRLDPFGAGRLTPGERKAIRTPNREQALKEKSGREIMQAFYLDEGFRYSANRVAVSLSSRKEQAMDIAFGVRGRVQGGSAKLPGTRENDNGKRKESLYGNATLTLVQGRLRLFDKSVRKDVGSGSFEQTVKGRTVSVTSGASLSASLPSPFSNKDVTKGKPSGVVDASAQITWYERQQSNMIRLHESADGRLDAFNSYRGTNDTRFSDFRDRVQHHRAALSALVGGENKLDEMLREIRERFPGGDVVRLIRWRLEQPVARAADTLRAMRNAQAARLTHLEARARLLGGAAGRNLEVRELRQHRETLRRTIEGLRQSIAHLDEKRAALLSAEQSWSPYGVGVNEINQREDQTGVSYMAILAGKKAVSGVRETDWSSSAAREGSYRENQRTHIAQAETRLLEQLHEDGGVNDYRRAVDAMLRRGSSMAAGQALLDFMHSTRFEKSLDDDNAMRATVRTAMAASGATAESTGWPAATLAWLAGDL